MFEIGAGGGGGTRLSDRLNAGHPGSLPNRIGDALKNGTGSYKDIDNGWSAGGHDGNGSPQSVGTIVTTGDHKHNATSGKMASRDSGSSGSSHSSHTSARKAWDYYEAPLAEKYHFGKATAYQEALANTSYRREMEDMRKAGLNPSVIYGSHSSSGAETNIYPRDDSSGGSRGYGGSGGYSRRSRGGNSGNYLFSGASYYGIMAATAAITTIATHNFGAGMAASAFVGTAMKAINGFFKK